MDLVLAATDAGLISLGGASPRIDRPVTALAGAGKDLWALTADGGIWRRDGRDWVSVVELDELRASCVLPVAQDTAYIGTSEAHLLRIRIEERASVERLRSFDRADGRSYWFTPWGGPPDVRSLSADAAGTLYANVHVGGILRSDDDGETWVPTIDIHEDVHQVLAHPDDPEQVAAATANGLAMSYDAGATWQTRAEGLEGAYCRAVAFTRHGTLVSASEGHHGRGAALYRSGLDTFARCVDGLPESFSDNIDTGCLVAQGNDAAFGTSDGDVFLSRDGGESWEQMAEGLGPIRAVLLAR